MKGTRLKELREARGMLQREYADALGVSRLTIVRAEQNDGDVSQLLKVKATAFEMEKVQQEAAENHERAGELQGRLVSLAKGEV